MSAQTKGPQQLATVEVPHSRSVVATADNHDPDREAKLSIRQGGYCATIGPTLIRNGYLVVPINPGQKRPAIEKDWPKARLGHADLARWPNHGVGVLCGQGDYPVVGVDIDISHPTVGPAVIEWCHKHLGYGCDRIGAAPRILLTYRAAQAGWSKRNSVAFFDPADPTKRDGKLNDQKVEVLGAGQQFVAYHVHPDTGMPYDWVDLFGGIEHMPAADLPVVSEQQMAHLMAEVARLVELAPGIEKKRGYAALPKGWEATGIDDDLLSITSRVGMPIEEVAMWTGYIKNDDQYDSWVEVGMGLHHEFSGTAHDAAALDIWQDHGSRSSKYDPVKTRTEWIGFNRPYAGRPKTLRTLLKRAHRDRREQEEAARYEALAEWRGAISQAATERELREMVCPVIRGDDRLNTVDRESLAQNLKDSFKRIGLTMPIVHCRDLVKADGRSLDTLGSTGADPVAPTRDHLQRALQDPNLAGAHIAFDEFGGETMLSVNGNDWQSFQDSDYFRLALRLETGPARFADIPTQFIKEAVRYVANLARVDSAKLWLNSLVWDGVPRIDTFLADRFGAKQSPYTKAIGQYLWTALAGRIIAPGIKADMMPVAVGRQGTKKSSSIRAIVPDEQFFGELDLGAKDDDICRQIRGKLVLEFGELKGLKRVDKEDFKKFVTRTHEKWTPKYMEFGVSYLRRCLLFGSTNRDEFLADDTGERRWLPFRSGDCDPDGIANDRDQLWAEGRELFNASGVLFQAAETLARIEHGQFKEVDPWQARVREWLQRRADLGAESANGPLTPEQVLYEAVLMPAKDHTKGNADRMSEVLKGLGFKRIRRRLPDGSRPGVYVRPDQPDHARTNED